MFENMNANLLAIIKACKLKCLITWIIVFNESCSGLIFFTVLLSLSYTKAVWMFVSMYVWKQFSFFFISVFWLPVSKYVCMYICLKDCSQTCLKSFFRVYKKTLTHVRLTINFIPSDKIYLYFVFPFGLHYCF